MSEMIALDGLTKKFGSLVAVDGISMSVSRGEVLGFLGPNGAGKSTTMKMITGFVTPTSGSARVFGMDVTETPREVKRRIGYLPEGAPLYGDMTPASFLDFIAAIRGFKAAEKRKRIDAVVERVALGEVLNRPIDTLSKGFKRRVGLAQALLHDPDVLILDEPTDGLDPNQKHHVRTLIREMAEDKAIVISTHILEEVEAVCTRAVIIAEGRLLADGTPEEFLAKAPTHNAVVVKLDITLATAACDGLESLATVERVETVANVNGLAHLRVLPKDGRPIVAEVGNLLRNRELPVHEIFTEHGVLDEVFRYITDGGKALGGSDA